MSFQMMEAAASAKAGGKKKPLSSTGSNFMRQFRDSESRELKQLTAQQFMEVWDHYDDDGEERNIRKFTFFKIVAFLPRNIEYYFI